MTPTPKPTLTPVRRCDRDAWSCGAYLTRGTPSEHRPWCRHPSRFEHAPSEADLAQARRREDDRRYERILRAFGEGEIIAVPPGESIEEAKARIKREIAAPAAQSARSVGELQGRLSAGPPTRTRYGAAPSYTVSVGTAAPPSPTCAECGASNLPGEAHRCRDGVTHVHLDASAAADIMGTITPPGEHPNVANAKKNGGLYYGEGGVHYCDGRGGDILLGYSSRDANGRPVDGAGAPMVPREPPEAWGAASGAPAPLTLDEATAVLRHLTCDPGHESHCHPVTSTAMFPGVRVGDHWELRCTCGRTFCFTDRAVAPYRKRPPARANEGTVSAQPAAFRDPWPADYRNTTHPWPRPGDVAVVAGAVCGYDRGIWRELSGGKVHRLNPDGTPAQPALAPPAEHQTHDYDRDGPGDALPTPRRFAIGDLVIPSDPSPGHFTGDPPGPYRVTRMKWRGEYLAWFVGVDGGKADRNESLFAPVLDCGHAALRLGGECVACATIKATVQEARKAASPAWVPRVGEWVTWSANARENIQRFVATWPGPHRVTQVTPHSDGSGYMVGFDAADGPHEFTACRFAPAGASGCVCRNGEPRCASCERLYHRAMDEAQRCDDCATANELCGARGATLDAAAARVGVTR